MSLQELKAQVHQLSVPDRWELLNTILRSLQIAPNQENWQYLVERSHPWRKQLYIKGRKLLASTVWQDIMANGMSVEQAAENWELPIAAIEEAIAYCETHQDLLRLEANEERYRLEAQGVTIEAAT